MILNTKHYDVLRWVALVLLPALATLYIAVAQIWNLPYSAEVAGTITAFDTFLGLVLGISKNNYDKNVRVDGSMVVGRHREDENETLFRLELDKNPEEIAKKGEMNLKVVTDPSDRGNH